MPRWRRTDIDEQIIGRDDLLGKPLPGRPPDLRVRERRHSRLMPGSAGAEKGRDSFADFPLTFEAEDDETAL